MRTFMIAIALAGSLLAACASEAPAGGEHDGFSGERALAHIRTQLSFGPRHPGTEGHTQIQEWIMQAFSRLEWSVERQEFTHNGVLLTNLIATPPGHNGQATLILGAHYDTRRFADRDLANPEDPVPGANDGASGVAVLIELASALGERAPAGLIFVLFDAEDQGRIDGWDWSLGATYFAENLATPAEAVVIVDMVGDSDLRLPFERSSDPALVDSIWSIGEQLGYAAFVREPGPALIDDHIPFIQRGIPAVLIVDFTYAAWHTTNDDIDSVSAASLEAVGSTLEHWLLSGLE